MEEQAKPTGITYLEAIEAARHGGTVTFEGREARVVSFNSKTSIDEPNTAQLTLELGGGRHVMIVGHFWGGEFVEERRQDPFSGAP